MSEKDDTEQGETSQPMSEHFELLTNSFRCCEREWTIDFTDELMTAVKKVTGFDLWKSVEINNSPLAALGDDEGKLRDALWVLVKEPAEVMGITREAFRKACCGDAVDDGYVAIQGGLERFFSARRRAALRRSIKFLEAKGQADIEHRRRTYEESLRVGKEAGLEAIGKIGTVIREKVMEKTNQQIDENLHQLMNSDNTSSNAAATLGSAPES